MPLVVQELNRSSATDSKQHSTLTREFIVNTLPPETALDAPGIPVANEPHPSVPAAFVDDRRVEPLGDGQSTRVSVVYSTDRRWRAPYKKPLPSDYSGVAMFEIAFTDVTMTYPYAIKQPRETPSGSGKVTKLFWVLQEIDVLEQRMIVNLRCSTQGMDGSKMSAIQAQINQIHVLPGFPSTEYYLFTSPTVTQRDTNWWDLHYTWIGDSGTKTPALTLPSGFSSSNIKLPDELNAQHFIRYAHNQIRPIPSADPETTPPTFINWQPYTFDGVGNGWNTLPGITL